MRGGRFNMSPGEARRLSEGVDEITRRFKSTFKILGEMFKYVVEVLGKILKPDEKEGPLYLYTMMGVLFAAGCVYVVQNRYRANARLASEPASEFELQVLTSETAVGNQMSSDR